MTSPPSYATQNSNIHTSSNGNHNGLASQSLDCQSYTHLSFKSSQSFSSSSSQQSSHPSFASLSGFTVSHPVPTSHVPLYINSSIFSPQPLPSSIPKESLPSYTLPPFPPINPSRPSNYSPSPFTSSNNVVSNAPPSRDPPETSTTNDKTKPSIIPVTRLQIGTWVRRSAFLGDIFCKFYFKKKQMVWEMMGEPMGILQKMVIQFSHVTRLHFSLPPDSPAVLTIFLSKPPTFYKEINPQPEGKNIQWVGGPDFTEGQASISSQHVLHFSKNVLNKHLGKLAYDDVLKNLIDPSSLPLGIQLVTNPSIEDDDEDEDEDGDVSPQSLHTISPLLLHQ